MSFEIFTPMFGIIDGLSKPLISPSEAERKVAELIKDVVINPLDGSKIGSPIQLISNDRFRVSGTI